MFGDFGTGKATGRRCDNFVSVLEATRLHSPHDTLQTLFRYGKQRPPRARTFLRQKRITTNDQALARKLGSRDFCQVTLIEEGGRDDTGRELLDIDGSQATDPVDTTQTPQIRNPSTGEHAPIPRQDDVGEVILLLKFGALVCDGGRITGIATVHLDRNRTSLGIENETIVHLLLAMFAISVVAEGGQRTVGAFHVA